MGLLLGWLLYSSTGDLLMAKMAGVAVWMAFWWISEAVHIYFTALLPLSAFPLLGIKNMEDVAPIYTNEIIFLFVGGFLIAFALEKWNLHKRIALGIILSIGKSPSRILLGFMLATYLLSMWISNTATTMMLLPAAIAVSGQFKVNGGDGKFMTIPLLLGLAYASSIGGTATLIGTVPNMVFLGFYNNAFPGSGMINFSRWMFFGVPMSALLFVGCYYVLWKMYISKFRNIEIDLGLCRQEYKALGKPSYEEKIMFGAFIATVLLWFFRTDIILGNFTIKGWINLFPEKDFIKDSTVAMLVASILFLIPSKTKGEFMLTWTEAKKIPMGIIFLFGGGFALAGGIESSGLSLWLADNLKVITGMPPLVIILFLTAFMIFLTELTSNTASTYLILPILLALSANMSVAPIELMLPVVIAASCAFMLPIATPPNTIVFGSELLTVRNMARPGLYINLISIVVILFSLLTFGKWVFGF